MSKLDVFEKLNLFCKSVCIVAIAILALAGAWHLLADSSDKAVMSGEAMVIQGKVYRCSEQN